MQNSLSPESLRSSRADVSSSILKASLWPFSEQKESDAGTQVILRCGSTWGWRSRTRSSNGRIGSMVNSSCVEEFPTAFRGFRMKSEREVGVDGENTCCVVLLCIHLQRNSCLYRLCASRVCLLCFARDTEIRSAPLTRERRLCTAIW